MQSGKLLQAKKIRFKEKEINKNLSIIGKIVNFKHYTKIEIIKDKINNNINLVFYFNDKILFYI